MKSDFHGLQPNNPDKIDEKWDKNKNNGFGFGPQFLIIKSTKIE